VEIAAAGWQASGLQWRAARIAGEGADFVGMGMPTYEKPGHPAGRQSFAADEGGKRPGNPWRIVGMGIPIYIDTPAHARGSKIHHSFT